MLKQMLLKEKRIAQLYTLIIFLLLALIFLAITFFLQINEDTSIRSEIEITQLDLVQLEKTTIESKINRRAADILFIADTLQLSGDMLSDYTAIARPWIAFSDRYKVFDQIRFLDISGQEKIRINYSPEGAYAVGQDALQNKADRYYFMNALPLRKDDIFISKLDLNIENGQIETPIKPMIRLATPFYGADDLEGVIVLNYSAEDMLSQVRNVAAGTSGEVYLLDKNGYWLYNSHDSGKEWAFMYEGREEESFAAAYPQEWQTITGNEGNGYFVTDHGVFTYASILPRLSLASENEVTSLVDGLGAFYIVSFIRADSAEGSLFSQNVLTMLGRVVMKYLSIYLLLTGIAFALAALIAVGRAQKKEIKYFSEFDAMTGVYNRRAGYGKLNELKKQSTDRGYTIAICFIDINGLKEVNDGLGHDAGDELIKSVAGVIRDSVRGNDFVSRLGGDEFLIVFDRLDIASAERVWKRIAGRFETINTEESRPYIISVSHGIGVFLSNEDVTVDEIIGRADELMYKEKNRLKKDLRVIRDPKEQHPD